MKNKDDKNSLDQRIDDHNNNRVKSTGRDQDGQGLTPNQRPAETHNKVSHNSGNNYGDNSVSTSLDDV